jgi:hypothetical protein
VTARSRDRSEDVEAVGREAKAMRRKAGTRLKSVRRLIAMAEEP